MKLKNVYILWTVYFDSSLSRSRGRRLPNKMCIPRPKVEELTEACREAGLKIFKIKEASYPRLWWRKDGYIAVEKSYPKQEILRRISSLLRVIRSRRGLNEGSR